MRIILLVILFFTFSIQNLAQRYIRNSSFISVFVGDLSILSERVTDYYDTKNDITFGIGIGIPISKAFTFDASISYYHKKSRSPSKIEINSISSAELMQLIYNAGLQLHLLPNRIIGLSLLFGINYASVSEERKNSESSILYELSDNGNLGIYGGANFEVNFGRTPIALHGDVKYTYAWDPVFDFADTYRELKYTGGVKFYLAKRWK